MLPARKRDQIGDLAGHDGARLGQTECRIVRPFILAGSEFSGLATVADKASAKTPALCEKDDVDLLVQTEGDSGCGDVHVAEEHKLPDLGLGNVLQDLRAFTNKELAAAALNRSALICDVNC